MKSILKVLSIALVFTFTFSTFVFADDPIDIASDSITKDTSNFVETMYYEPRERVNNISFFDGEYRLSSIKDYIVEYKDNELPGTATVTYIGVNKYTGTYSATFVIKKMPMENITTKASFNSKKELEVSANNGSEDLIRGKDYNYTHSTDVDGNVTVIITGIGTKYTGSVTKTIKAKNNPNPSARSYLKDVTLTKYKNKKSKKIELKWKKISNIAGYQIKYYKKGASSSAKKVTVNATTKKYIIKKLKKKKTYSVKMRSYIVYNNKKYYSSWSKAVNVKIKK